jgi:hypothetical protein
MLLTIVVWDIKIICNKFAKILNNNTINVKIAFKTKNNLIKFINDWIKNFTENPPFYWKC